MGGHFELNVTTGEVTKYYCAGAQTVAMRKVLIPQYDTLTYLTGDHLGSTSLATDATGTLISETRYKPWGEVRYTTNNSTLPTRYTYTGQYSYMDDPATDLDGAGFGLMFYNARWYDPVLGRFAQADTVIPPGIQGYDRFAYSNNNPIRYIDPSGHFPLVPIFLLILLLAGCSTPPTSTAPTPSATSTPTATVTSTPTATPTATATATPPPAPLSVSVVPQPDSITCGQAAYTATWNYEHPSTPLDVNTVVNNAYNQGWNIGKSPYTSPENMKNMGNYYANEYGYPAPITGNYSNSADALAGIQNSLSAGNPVIADVTVYVGNPNRTQDAHFVTVTGYDPTTNTITYVDPWGQQDKSHQAGTYTMNWDDFWKSWQENNDDNGQGWYMIVQ